jgi:hypothetical protein
LPPIPTPISLEGTTTRLKRLLIVGSSRNILNEISETFLVLEEFREVIILDTKLEAFKEKLVEIGRLIGRPALTLTCYFV